MEFISASNVKKTEDFARHLELVNCDFCGNDSYKVLFASTLAADDFKDSHRHYSISKKSPCCGQIVQCTRCGLVYVNPRERPQDILYNYTIVEDEKYLAEQRARNVTFLRGLRLLERYCPQRGNLLEVGSFTGLFLDLAREHGWSVLGVEPSRWAVAHARGKLNLPILRGTLGDFKFDDGFFDAVAMWDVVEHLPDPKRTLLTLSKKLKNRGILFLNTVNYASIFRKIFGKKYWFIERMHIYYFTPQTMRKMLEACGYEVLRIIPHFKALSLGYFIERIREISIVPAAIISPLSSFMHAGKHIISVYAGQMTVIARKKG